MPTAELPLVANVSTIEVLNQLLEGEISAVDTYERLISEFGSESPNELAAGLRSHQSRVQALTVRILDLGGKPTDGGGLWASFVALFESGAALFGRKTAFCALAEGEAHGVTVYREALDKVDAESRHLLEVTVIPEQLKTRYIIHNINAALKNT